MTTQLKNDLDWPPQRISALRKRLKLSREDFGFRIGVTRMTVWNYEAGQRKVRDAHVILKLQQLEALP